MQLQDMVCFRKVTAHQVPTADMSDEQHWTIRWNAVADANAKRVLRYGLPEAVRVANEDLLHEHATHQRDSKRFQHFLLAMAERGLQSSEMPEREPSDEF